MNRRERRAKIGKPLAPQRQSPDARSPLTFRLLGPLCYFFPVFFASTAAFVAEMAVAYLHAPVWAISAPLTVVLLLLAKWVASSFGSCHLYDDRLVFKRFQHTTEVPLKGLEVQIGSYKAVLAAKAEWISPQLREGITLPMTSLGTWPQAYEFLLALQERGVKISATGFTPWEAIQPITFRIDFVRNVKFVGLLIVAYVAVVSVIAMLGRLGFPITNVPTIFQVILIGVLLQPDVRQIILRTPEVTWSRNEVTRTKGRKILWTLSKRDLKAIVIERRGVVAGLEMSRLCLITHYNRRIPLTPWSPQMAEEFNLIGLALGWGLDVRIDSALDQGGSEAALQQTDSSVLLADAEVDAKENLPRTFM